MYYKCHKASFDSPDWIKKKKATINPKNKDNKCFQYAVMVILNYEETESPPERVSNIKAFINKYNWKEINYWSKIKNNDWKMLKISQQLRYFNFDPPMVTRICNPSKSQTWHYHNPVIALNLFCIKEKEMSSLYLK